MNLREYLQQARKEERAVGHFNVSTLEMIRGILAGAKEAGVFAVMIGTSEGEAAFIGRLQAVALIKAFREEYGIPVFLNADHHKSVEAAKEAVDAGYDSIHIDLSKLPYAENRNGTKEVVLYAKERNPNISVEGELGYLPTDSSKLYKENVVIDPESLTKPEEAAAFVLETGIDRFAAAVGNVHGIAANEPQLDFSRVQNIRSALPEHIAFVLHGGSGIPNVQIRQAITCGINNVHVSTELRLAYTRALRESLAARPEETTPYKLMPLSVNAVKQIVIEKLALFSSKNGL
jgi:fructose-bisphosphate aldolase, class II